MSTLETTETEGRKAERIRKRAVWGGVSLQKSLVVLHHRGESHHPREKSLCGVVGLLLAIRKTQGEDGGAFEVLGKA